MTNDPDQIRRDIEDTRASLSADVDTLNEKVNPRYAFRRGQGRIRDGFTKARESVMGATPTDRSQASSAMGSAQDKASSAAAGIGGAASSAATSVKDTAASTTDTVVRRTEGNPLAAGLIAFGAGWLTSSLLPSSQAEQQAGGQLKDVADSVADEAKQVARDTAEQIKEPAQQAAESVRSTAQDAAGKVGDEAQLAGQDVKEQTRESGQNVRRDAGQ